MVVAGEEGFLIILEGAVCERFADAVDGMDDEMLIVDTSEDLSGDFVGFEKMVEVALSVIFTTFAVAVGH